MYKCPHCGKLSFTFWQKLNLGPGRVIKCKNCGKKVGVSYWILSCIILIFLVFSIEKFFNTLFVKITIYGIGIILYFFVSVNYFPLISREEIIIKETGERAKLLEKHSKFSTYFFMLVFLMWLLLASFHIFDRLVGVSFEISEKVSFYSLIIIFGSIAVLSLYNAYITYVLNINIFAGKTFTLKNTSAYFTSKTARNILVLISLFFFILSFVLVALIVYFGPTWT